MSDQASNLPPGLPPGGLPNIVGAPSPPAMYASQFLIAGNQAEVTVTMGQTRMLMNQGSSAGSGIEWLLTLAMSPVAAKQLGTGLVAAVQAWEKAMNVTLPDMTPPAAPSN